MAENEPQEPKSFDLPVILSTSALLNAVVRGTEVAAGVLGTDYHAVVRKDLFKSVASVYRTEPLDHDDIFDTAQLTVAGETPVWSMELSDRYLRDERDRGAVFSKIPSRYFFLNYEDARAHLETIKAATVTLILSAAELREEAIKNGE